MSSSNESGRAANIAERSDPTATSMFCQSRWYRRRVPVSKTAAYSWLCVAKIMEHAHSARDERRVRLGSQTRVGTQKRLETNHFIPDGETVRISVHERPDSARPSISFSQNDQFCRINCIVRFVFGEP